MSRPTVATVVSARAWEAALASAATKGARIRLVARTGSAFELARTVAHTDVVVIGSETPWLEPWVFEVLSRFGVATIGVHAAGDRPAAALSATATLRFEESVQTDHVVAAAATLAVS